MPYDLELDILVAVLRREAVLNVHCYKVGNFVGIIIFFFVLFFLTTKIFTSHLSNVIQNVLELQLRTHCYKEQVAIHKLHASNLSCSLTTKNVKENYPSFRVFL